MMQINLNPETLYRFFRLCFDNKSPEELMDISNDNIINETYYNRYFVEHIEQLRQKLKTILSFRHIPFFLDKFELFCIYSHSYNIFSLWKYDKTNNEIVFIVASRFRIL